MDFTNLLIISYEKTDILHHIEKYGFSKDKTFGEMLDLALKYESPIIVKAGKNAKWYLHLWKFKMPTYNL